MKEGGLLIRVFSLSFEGSARQDSYVPKFEADLAHYCEKLVMDLDRRVRRGRERLDQEVEVPPLPAVPVEKSEQLSVLEEKIKNLLEQVEALGEAGKVDEAEALMRKVDVLNAEKTALTQQPQNDKVLVLAQEKKMALCETCGSLLIANDAIERTQSHVTGKQHIGYVMVRDFLTEFKERKEKAREEERLRREKEAEERRKQRENEVESRSRRSDSGDRDRNRDRDKARERDGYRDQYFERSHERNGRGCREGGRGLDWKYTSSRSGRGGSRDRYREGNRIRSPTLIRRGHRRSP
ncbi:Spliceosome subunit [Heracleum sosnowskyi]|uniref:Spliceosome subunit n=1 Tax=Heracleum sosnowskyi TaxID=360622 RepID=A0AAD8GQX6_9APIA|nr:Spliceosome subunit [Heracleum sosnowskyi]